MRSLMLSLLFYALNWVVRAVMFKAVLYIALWYFTTEACQYLLTKIEFGGEGFQGALSNVNQYVVYFLVALKLDAGLPLIISAMMTRFAIRRLPIIG